jgi:acetoin utilization protein AcuB
MTSNPATVRPESDPMAAQTLLRYGKFRRLPVVDENDQLVGIITMSDLDLFFSTAPSPGVVKRQYRVDQVMKTPVIMVSPDYPLEEAAQLMLEHHIGGLPVVEEKRLVGIITESDILSQIVEVLGGDSTSLRITVQVPDRPGQLARVASQIAALDCNICSILSAQGENWVRFTMRLAGADSKEIVQAIQDLEEIDVTHVWTGS